MIGFNNILPFWSSILSNYILYALLASAMPRPFHPPSFYRPNKWRNTICEVHHYANFSTFTLFSFCYISVYIPAPPSHVTSVYVLPKESQNPIPIKKTGKTILLVCIFKS